MTKALKERLERDDRARQRLEARGYTLVLRDTNLERLIENEELIDDNKFELFYLETRGRNGDTYHETWTRPKYTKEQLWEMVYQWEQLDYQINKDRYDNEEDRLYTIEQIRKGVKYF